MPTFDQYLGEIDQAEQNSRQSFENTCVATQITLQLDLVIWLKITKPKFVIPAGELLAYLNSHDSM